MSEVYIQQSNNFEIQVVTSFDFQRSNPLRFHYMFKYKITIINLSDKTSQLISRKWSIVDGQENVEFVEGPGVVGNQPLFRPKEKFTYQSFCPLSTRTGRMYGQYFMKDEHGDFFAIDTPVFYFKIPEELLSP